jgi:hypothetical protein
MATALSAVWEAREEKPMQATRSDLLGLFLFVA